MAVSTVKLNGQTLMTVNDTTATQADVNSSKYFYGADGVKRQGSATPSTPTLITKSITANGTYNAEDDNADGYSSVTVSVSGGASNVVTGTFKGTTTGAAMDVNLAYTGTGYPISVMIFPTEGPNNDVSGTFYGLIQRYACQLFFAAKSEATTTPTYGNPSGLQNSMTGICRYKNSTTSATTYTQAAFSGTTYILNDIDPTNSSSGIVTMRSATKMSVYIASTSYGFAANIEYTYVVQYSS